MFVCPQFANRLRGQKYFETEIPHRNAFLFWKLLPVDLQERAERPTLPLTSDFGFTKSVFHNGTVGCYGKTPTKEVLLLKAFEQLLGRESFLPRLFSWGLTES
jgi:hypothetical protein